MPMKMDQKEMISCLRKCSPARRTLKDRHSNKQSGKLSAMDTLVGEPRDSVSRHGAKDAVRTSPKQADDFQESDGAHTSSIVLGAIAAAKARRSARAALLQHEMLRRSESPFNPSVNGSIFHDATAPSDKRYIDEGRARMLDSLQGFTSKAEGPRGTTSVVTISPIRATAFSMHQSDLLSPSAALSPDIDFIRRLAIEDNRNQTPAADSARFSPFLTTHHSVLLV